MWNNNKIILVPREYFIGCLTGKTFWVFRLFTIIFKKFCGFLGNEAMDTVCGQVDGEAMKQKSGTPVGSLT